MTLKKVQLQKKFNLKKRVDEKKIRIYRFELQT